jgi:hypothetical protein
LNDKSSENCDEAEEGIIVVQMSLPFQSKLTIAYIPEKSYILFPRTNLPLKKE